MAKTKPGRMTNQQITDLVYDALQDAVGLDENLRERIVDDVYVRLMDNRADAEADETDA